MTTLASFTRRSVMLLVAFLLTVGAASIMNATVADPAPTSTIRSTPAPFAKQGWPTSSHYPSSTPNLHSPLYFDGAIATHGTRGVPAGPASKDGARVTVKGADYLFARLEVGDPIRVTGSY